MGSSAGCASSFVEKVAIALTCPEPLTTGIVIQRQGSMLSDMTSRPGTRPALPAPLCGVPQRAKDAVRPLLRLRRLSLARNIASELAVRHILRSGGAESGHSQSCSATTAARTLGPFGWDEILIFVRFEFSDGRQLRLDDLPPGQRSCIRNLSSKNAKRKKKNLFLLD